MDRNLLSADCRGVVFDKDGTLTDLNASWVPAFHALVGRALALLGRPSDGIGEVLGSLGVDADGLVPDGLAAVGTGGEVRRCLVSLLATPGASGVAVSDAVERAFREAKPGPVVPIGDVVGTIERLIARGLSVGVATSDDRANAEHELEVLGIRHHVSALACGDDPGPIKPEPGVLLSICEQWVCSPAEVVFVGDSRQDMETARAAGTRFVAVAADGHPRPWVVGHTLSSIEQLI